MNKAINTGDVICLEHNTLLDDADLIDAIIEASKESPCATQPIDGWFGWAKLPRTEQIALQLAWVEPMPMF